MLDLEQSWDVSKFCVMLFTDAIKIDSFTCNGCCGKISTVYSYLDGLSNGKASYFLILFEKFILWYLAVLYSMLQI